MSLEVQLGILFAAFLLLAGMSVIKQKLIR
jgi:hypothetical protein